MISEVTKEEIRRHAREKSPEEACGFVLPGGEILRARNKSNHPEASFFADGRSTIKARLKGALFLYHSHPKGGAQPSDFDKEGCKRFGMPYLIYSMEEDRFVVYDPSPKWGELVGREFEWGKADCFTIVQDYFKLMHDILVMDFPRHPDWPVKYDFYREHYEILGFRVMPAGHVPVRDDVISFHNMSPYENHLAVMLGEHILHHPVGRLSRFEDYTKPWRDRVKYVYRHRDLGEG